MGNDSHLLSQNLGIVVTLDCSVGRSTCLEKVELTLSWYEFSRSTVDGRTPSS